jgi:hypothetical protein
MRKILPIACLVLLAAKSAGAQYVVRGTVFDSSRRYVIEAVSVLSTGGRGTITDSLGRYSLAVSEKDSIWFSFLGRPTPKYPVLKIADIQQFDIALRMKVDVLPTVQVRSRYYREDSAQNRKDYAKAFNFQRPNLSTMTSVGPNGAGFDINEIIRLFQFRKNRSMERFRERLLQQERDKFIDHRFTKGLARRLTGLDGPQLEQFMLRYRPPFEFAAISSDYDFHLYIKEAGEEFKREKAF